MTKQRRSTSRPTNRHNARPSALVFRRGMLIIHYDSSTSHNDNVATLSSQLKVRVRYIKYILYQVGHTALG